MPHQLAGKKVPKNLLEDIPKLISNYYILKPEITKNTQKVSFGTTGHRGCSNKKSFNEIHILAITQAICEYRKKHNIKGKLFIGKDNHALSMPAFISVVQVCVANNVSIIISKDHELTPTPLISFNILDYTKKSKEKADGIILTPSHNPPSDGGIKYNPFNGGPANTAATSIIESRANELIANNLNEVKTVSYEDALKSDLLEEYDFITPYVKALNTIIDMDAIKNSNLNIGIDPLGGSGIEVYKKINEIYDLNLDIINEYNDPTFSFMSCDHDGKVRMDCSSPYAMTSLIEIKDKYDIAVANDPDFDRHGIVTKSVGLMNPNHYLSVAIWYLCTTRKQWNNDLKIGKTLVSSSMIDRVVNSIDKKIFEVPVGFKWYVEELIDGNLAFGGEESAGASFVRFDGSIWTTDKDGIILNLLAMEITAKLKKDPGVIYQEFEKKFGKAYYERIDEETSYEEKSKLKNLSADDIKQTTLAGEAIVDIFTNAQGNDASIGGLKVTTQNGWFAARPSGTEDIYKIYAESFISKEHLKQIQKEAKELVHRVIG